MRIWISADLPFEVPRHQRLAKQFHAMHLRFDAASAVVSTPASPHRAAQISLRIDRIVAGNCSGTRRLPGLCILTWRDDRMGISGGNRLVAFTRVIRPICGNAADVLIGGIWFRSSGSMGASPMLLLVTSTARTSSVSSSMPMCILRHMRRLEPPCLRAFHSPSPSALIPVLSMRRFNGPRSHDKAGSRSVFAERRQRVLKSGTAQSNPTNLQ